MNVQRTTTALLILSSFVSASSAQTTLGTYPGNSGLDRMQVSAGGRDLDGDGVDDFLVAAPNDGADAGIVFAYAGGSGTELWTVQGAGGERLGHALALIDDMTGDGVPDVVAGAPGAEQSPGFSPGAVRILSGVSGDTLLERWGADDGGELGFSVASGFDSDHDGVEDFAAGAPSARSIGAWSGANGTNLWYGGSALPIRTGYSMAGVGDVDQDGFDDLATGAPGIGSNKGIVTVHGAFSIVAPASFDDFGWSIAPADDFDNDGHADFLVGSPRAFVSRGQVQLISGATGGELLSWAGDAAFDELGTSVARIGDVDDDGKQDFVMGAPEPGGGDPGYARVVSLKFGLELYTLRGEDDDDLFGERVGGVGDVNDDGVPDFGVGNPEWDVPLPFTKPNSGRVTLFSGGGPGFVSYCTAGTSASGCQAQISGSGTPSSFLPSGFTLSATGAEGDKTGLFFYGTNGRQANPWGNGTSYQCVVPPVQRAGVLPKSGTPGACDGSYSQDLNAYWQANTNKNPGAGAVVQAQLWHRDPAGTSNQTTSLSNALELAIGN